MTSFDIYQLDKADKPDLFAQIRFWKRYFKLKGGLFRTFSDGYKNILIEMDLMLKEFENDKIVNYSHAKMEREYAVCRNLDKKISEDAFHDSNLFMDIKTSLDDYRDEEKDSLILKNFEQQLKDAKNAFFDQIEKTDLAKEKYHKKEFEAEKIEIKKEIADKEEEIKIYSERFETLKAKIEKTIEKYKAEFNKLKGTGKILKDVSNKYTEAKISVDSKRADFIIGQLKKYSEEAKMYHDDIEDLDFEGVRVSEVIKSRLPQEHVVIKKMERYKRTKNKEELLRQMKLEMEQERMQGRGDDFKEDRVDNTFDAEASTSNTGAGQKYLIIRAFKKDKPNQISLTEGKYIKLIMPANSKGFAFGEMKGRFGRKKKGYFPLSHVTPVD